MTDFASGVMMPFDAVLTRLQLQLREDSLMDSDTWMAADRRAVTGLAGKAGRPRKRCRYIVADKGYDSNAAASAITTG
ncbi:hypothetical protein PRZ61_01045 [Halomonas pacifica]|nr:hypothetical protein [Halomonas pacifica]MDC8802034.1 hypothetical protein [Halomonas pacifica]